MLYFTVVCCSLLCEDIIFLAAFLLPTKYTWWLICSVGNMKYSVFLYSAIFYGILYYDISCHLPRRQFCLDEPLCRRYKSRVMRYSILWFYVLSFNDGYTACKTAHPLSAVSCCVLFLAVIIWFILSYSVLSVTTLVTLHKWEIINKYFSLLFAVMSYSILRCVILLLMQTDKCCGFLRS